MEKIVSLAKRRGFIFPGSEIYGGLQNSWDFGPLGVELKNNIKEAWWNRFVRRRQDIFGIDAALLMNSRVWETSGHLKGFVDSLVECKKCHGRFREDHLKKSDQKLVCPECGSQTFTESRNFNLMLKTFLGPAEERVNEVYFRPETAQGIFVNFKNILDTMRPDLPFGVAQIGKAFRNEITPGNFIFRMREFEQMEIEYFIPEPTTDKDWEQSFEEWRKEMIIWIKDLGIDLKNIYEAEISEAERAHYSKRTIDFEYSFPFGKKELYGLAYRTNYDLKKHSEASGINLRYKNLISGHEFYPHVIEPSFGVERSVLAALLEAYVEEEVPTVGSNQAELRVVLKFPKWLAPIKIGILPLLKKPQLCQMARDIYDRIKNCFVSEYDETQSIGRRYRRQDEIGTPYCVTVDFESIKDKTVTVRDRDTMKQERVKADKLVDYFKKRLDVFRNNF